MGTTTVTELSRGITDVFGHVEQEALLYLAPETLRGATPASAQTLDVYGVGAVAFLVLTKKAPAANLAALEALIASDATGLDPRAVMPELPDAHANVILEATAFREDLRLLDIGDFQTYVRKWPPMSDTRSHPRRRRAIRSTPQWGTSSASASK